MREMGIWKLLFPSAFTIMVILFLSADLLGFLYVYQIFTPYLLWPAYGLACYALLVLALGLTRFFLRSIRRGKELHDIRITMSFTLGMSWILNILFAGYYLYAGLTFHSFWFDTLALFYLSLSTARMVLLMEFRHDQPNLRSEYRKYTECGYALLFMTIALVMASFSIVKEHHFAAYKDYLMYILAGFSLYLIVSSLVGLARFYHYNSPVLSACKMLSLASASIGIYSLQTAVLARLYHGTALEETANRITGTAIVIFMLVLSLFMIVKGGRRLADEQTGGRMITIEQTMKKRKDDSQS